MTEPAERPQQIGPYRILDVLGEGGMGTVYLAEQQEPVRLRVALKLIKLGMDSKVVVARFEQERQALAVMQHDGIAKVFNCGTSERGQPYFVMELVKGIPLNQFCEQNRLPLPQRLMLMQQVCAAVQHAHQKGVVHRDLKPGNVLVSDEGGKLQIKIIDFGLAKAMGQKLVEATLFTEAGQVVGTPEYMAPEQADPTNQDIDTRADIYSLGVMLYELLVGSLPFPGHELRKAGMLEVQRILREVEPKRPSTKLQSSLETVAEVAAARRMSASALVRALERDLNWVALKALEKDRNRRYETANALAMDLQRFLDHEPLVAGPPSASYRLRKLVRRHRGQVLAGAAVLLALLGGGIGTFVQYLRAEDKTADALQQKGIAEAHEHISTKRAEENEKLAKEKGELALAEEKAKQEAQQSAAAAEQRAAELEQVLTFQESQWKEVDTESMGVHLRRALLASAKEERRADLDVNLAGVNFTDQALGMLQQNLFDRSLVAIGKAFAEQPLVKARLLQSVADALRELGLLDRAAGPQAEALEIRRRILGSDHPVTLASINNMGTLLQAQGKLAEAEPLYRECLARRRQILGDDDPDTLRTINNMGTLLQAQGKLAEAESFQREALEQRRRVLGDDNLDTLQSLNNLGTVIEDRGNLAEAESIYREVVMKFRRVLGDDHPNTLTAINNMGLLLKDQGRPAEAEPLYREALEKRRRILGDDHPSTLHSMNNMVLLLEALGRSGEAEQLCREALAKCRQILGDDHPDTLTSTNNMGFLLQTQSKFAEAELFYRSTLERRRRILGDDHPDTLVSIGNMGHVLKLEGKVAEAEPLYREAMEMGRRILGDDHPDTLQAINNMGTLFQAQGKFDDAEPLYREALEKTRRIRGEDHPHTLVAIHNMGSVLQAQGKLAEAEPFLRETLEKSRRILGDDNSRTRTAMSNLASVLQAQGKLAEAEPLLREGLERSRRLLGDDHQNTLIAINNLGSLLVQTGRHRDAVALLSAAEVAARRVFTGGNAHRLAAFLEVSGESLAGLAQASDFALAEAKLREAYTIFAAARGDRRKDIRGCAQTLVGLYEAWHLAEPGGGHDQQAAEWKAKLATEPAKEASK